MIKTVEVIGMVGTEEAWAEMRQLFAPLGISLEAHYTLEDELAAALETNQDITAVILLESQIANKYESVEKIRMANATTRIIFCANGPEKNTDSEFESWCFTQQIYDIFYPDKATRFKMNDIAAAIVKGKIELEEIEEIQIERETRAKKGKRLFLPSSEKKEKVKKEVAPAAQTIYIDRPVEVVKEVVKVIEKPVFAGTFCIAFWGLCHGAGVTSTAIEIAEELESQGYHTSIVGLDNSGDLAYYSGKISCFVPEGTEKAIFISQLLASGQYKFVIVDFGVLFSITQQGELLHYDLADNKQIISEFLRCRLNVGFCFAAPWHENKIKYFLDKDLFPGSQNYIFLYNSDCQKARKTVPGFLIEERKNFNTSVLLEKIKGCVDCVL